VTRKIIINSIDILRANQINILLPSARNDKYDIVSITSTGNNGDQRREADVLRQLPDSC